jgi:hypothetical protein
MSARVLLTRLSIRTSAKGSEYLSGSFGAAPVVAFKSKEPDKFGNERWEVYLSEPEPKGDQRQQPTRGQSTWDRSRDHDLPTGRTEVHRNERRDPRQEHIDELAARFDERGSDEVPW